MMAGNNIPTGGTPAGGAAPAGGADNQFKQDLKGKSEEELKGMLKDPSLTAEQKEAVLDELTNRKDAAKKAEESEGPEETKGGGDEEGGEDDIEKLRQKLKDGTITPEELEKLAGMLGVDPKDLEGMKGKGGKDAGTPDDPNQV
jgi:hypothetical protein